MFKLGLYLKKIISIILKIRLLNFIFIKFKFFFKTGKRLDLNKKYFSSYLINLKLNYKSELNYHLYADKIKVRNYIKQTVGNKYLSEIQLITNKLSFEQLFSLKYPLIIKTNHTSHANFIIKSLSELSKSKLSKIIWLNNFYQKFDFGSYSGEKWYSNIPPSIFIESLINDKNKKIPKDFKVHCFTKANKFIIMVDSDRFTNHSRRIYDQNWNDLGFSLAVKKSDFEIEKPIFLNEMLTISKKLSSIFPYVRVDFLVFDNKLIVNELTFCESSGYLKFIPNYKDIDLTWGHYLD